MNAGATGLNATTKIFLFLEPPLSRLFYYSHFRQNFMNLDLDNRMTTDSMWNDEQGYERNTYKDSDDYGDYLYEQYKDRQDFEESCNE